MKFLEGQRMVSSKKRVLYGRAARLLMPTLRTTPDQWAKLNRRYPPSAGVPGPRDPGLTPYMIAFGRAISAGGGQYRRAVMVCGAQMGKTDAVLDVIGERLDTRPAPIMYVGPSRDFNTDQFEPRLAALFDEAPSLAAKLARGQRNKKTKKLVAGVPIRLAHAGFSADDAIPVGSFDSKRQNLNFLATKERVQCPYPGQVLPLSRTGEHFANGKDTGA